MLILDKRKIIFLALFSALVLTGYQVNVFYVLGAENQSFTLFQFLGPLAGSFLGPFVGSASVLIAELANFLLAGKEANIINLFRLAPMLFAAYYFGTESKKSLGAWVSVACMFLFWMHPIGSQVWFYPLYWLIPPLAKYVFPRNLFTKSLGATFTAHAVGSILFLYTIPTMPELWIMLIPIVAIERLIFALGISGSYITVNTVLSRIPSDAVHVNPRYVLFSGRLRLPL
jgi:hypothetical protein